jgi:phosphoglycerate dehydrogenase-like enzyme
LACTSPGAHTATGQQPGIPPARAEAAIESIGSLRNATVAYPMQGERVELLYLAGDMDAAQLAECARLAPNVRIESGLSREQALALAPRANGVDAQLLPPAFHAAAPNVVWAQSGSAGVERYLALEGLVGEPRIVLTNMRGVHGPAIADHVFAMLLVLTRDLRFHLANQSTGTWGRAGSGQRPIALQGRTLLVVGLGGIGSEVAARGHGFGMRVLATRRSAAPKPPIIEYVGTPEELPELLAQADVVVICLPLTPETEGLFDAKTLAAMKPGAYLLNIGRGRIVDTQALVEALRSGHLGAAGLDVTDPEPLPADHPLWRMPNVIITPHVSNDAELTDARADALRVENIRRFGAGEPLLNVVDKAAGY